jgi:hypothetical protein
MSFSQMLISYVPPLVLGSIIVVLAIVLSVGGLLVFRRFISNRDLKIHNDVAGFMFGTLGVIYAVLLAFMVIVVWETFDSASSNVEKEASRLADLYRDSEAFQEPDKKQVWNLLSEYGKAIVVDEWKTASIGEKSAKTQKAQDELCSFYETYTPKTKTEEVFFEESVRKLNELCEFRRLRLMESRNGIDSILWFVLIFCGVMTIVFTFFFGMENIRNQMIMTSILAVTIALILFTILEFDYPFTGELSVSSDPFKRLRMFNGVNWEQLEELNK